MATSTFSAVDEYGFERSLEFDFKYYERFMSEYIGILARRLKRWEDLSNSERKKKSGTLKRFVRKGIPISLRESAWMTISGAEELKRNSKYSFNTLRKRKTNSVIKEAIEMDIPRTFPDNIFFDKDSTLPEQLLGILIAFANSNTDIGYCQGMNYIAGLLLLVTKNAESSFWLLKTLVERILPQYYSKNMSGLITDLAVLDKLVQKNEPAVHRHIESIGLPWAVTTTKWFICIYAEVLPTETVLRIWDSIFYEGSKVIFRVALTLIKMHRNKILECKDMTELVKCFKEMGSHHGVINCHQFMKNVFRVPGSFPNKLLEDLRRQHNNSK
ncbi:growth hormone-regulated TBC protein 1 [Agrilus planipennis]|uniref:Growth hormone-regulated TBC protein 1 n=1 Tax=Agrilus planipennis TaxID=224129 RepID=A0A1W4XCX1_AGRPL|nr:growth hormone-regulated TBC protein 1 [Agrilus planipennis]